MNDLERIKAQFNELPETVRDYLNHPSEEGSPLRREKRRKLALMVESKEVEHGNNNR